MAVRLDDGIYSESIKAADIFGSEVMNLFISQLLEDLNQVAGLGTPNSSKSRPMFRH